MRVILRRALVRSPAAVLGAALVVVLLALFATAPLLSPYDPAAQDVAGRLAAPSGAHWLGTDGFGRDLITRVLYGGRATLLLVAFVSLLMAPIGVVVGVVAGTAGGWTERLLMRLTDITMAFPRLILAFAFVALLGPGLFNGALALGLTSWPPYARQVRVEIATIRASDYLAAAEMAGIRGARLLVGHVLPLILPTTLVRLALDLGGIILAAAGLGFLGLGVRPPTPEWGSMVAEGTQVIFDQWWVAAAPGVAILLASLAFNVLADGLRDLLDPRHA